MDLAIFRTEGIFPVEKDILKMSLNCGEMSFFSSFKIFTGMLFGSDDLMKRRYYERYFIFVSWNQEKGV